MALLFIVSGCNAPWHQGHDGELQWACRSQAATWLKTDSEIQAYCNCVVPLIKERYPNALANAPADSKINEILKDSAVHACLQKFRGKAGH